MKGFECSLSTNHPQQAKVAVLHPAISKIFQTPLTFFAWPDSRSADSRSLLSGNYHSRGVPRGLFLRGIFGREAAGAGRDIACLAAGRRLHTSEIWGALLSFYFFWIVARSRESHVYRHGWVIYQNRARREISLIPTPGAGTVEPHCLAPDGVRDVAVF